MIAYQERAQRISRNAVKLDHAVRDGEDYTLDLDFTSAIRRYREAGQIISDQIALLTLQLEAERNAGRVCSRLGCGGPAVRTIGGERLCILHIVASECTERRS